MNNFYDPDELHAVYGLYQLTSSPYKYVVDSAGDEAEGKNIDTRSGVLEKKDAK